MRTLAFFTLILLVASVSIANAVSFNTANGWFVDWGLTITLESDFNGPAPGTGGTRLDWKENGSALSSGFNRTYTAASNLVYYNLEDFTLSDSLPLGGEEYDVEGIFTLSDTDWHYFLVVTSFGDRTGKLATVGDLAINPNGTWNTAGGNTSDVGVKFGGGKAGYGMTNPEWGYGWDTSDTAGADLRNPLLTSGNNPNGLRPDQADDWGGNFWWVPSTGDANVIDPTAGTPEIFFNSQQIFTDGDTPEGETHSTWAFGVKLSNDVVDHVSEVHYAPSCLNDSSRLQTPEPGTLAMLICSGGAFVIRRARRKGR